MILYSETDLFYRSPFGAVAAGQPVRFRLAVPREYRCETPFCMMNRDGKPPSLFAMEKTGEREDADLFTFVFTPQLPGLYFYHFDLYRDYRKIYRGPLLTGAERFDEGDPFQLTVYYPAFTTPEPMKGGVIYQIFPDRFFEGRPQKPLPFPDRIYRADKKGEPFFTPLEEGGKINLDYFGGDFAGIQQKLPYLRDLGVTCLYLNPIFEAHENHRYNTADYLKPDPMLGTEAEFSDLCAEARAMGIAIILDGVFSHTGADSVYFNKIGRYGEGGAYRDPQSPYRPWYFFGREYPAGYRSWWNFPSLPEVNEEDPAYRQFICGVVDHWMALGAAGFRLDVADELPDDFIVMLRERVKSFGPDRFLVGEVWEDASNKVSYGARRGFLWGRELDSVMNYPFRSAILRFLREGDGPFAAEVFLSIAAHYPKPALDVTMNLLASHDTERAITAAMDEEAAGRGRQWQSGRHLCPEMREEGIFRLRLGYALLFTLPGVPVIYYGDEIAMEGYRDPFNRAYYDWGSTEERLRSDIRRLSELRRENESLRTGTFQVLKAEKEELWYRRCAGENAVIVAVNRGGQPAHLCTEGEEYTCAARDWAVFFDSGAPHAPGRDPGRGED